jgi:lipopolysaccharide transport system ATP-binding protein
MTALREWIDPKEAPGTELVRLCAVRVKTEDDRISEAVDIRQPVGIEMEYEINKAGYIALPYYDIFNQEGIHVFTAVDQDTEWRKRTRPAGRYRSTAWIPGNLLSEGMLFVNAVLVTLNPNVLHYYVRDAVAFNVIDSLDGDSARGDWVGSMSGAVRPLLKWTTKFSPLGSKIAQ